MTLDRHLENLAIDVTFPATPDFARVVMRRIEQRRTRNEWQRRFLLAAAIVVLIVIVSLVVPNSRTTIANWFGLGGIRIEFVDRLVDRDDVVEIDSALIVGDEIDLDDAVMGDGVPVMGIPGSNPERVYRRIDGTAITISMIYAQSEELPGIEETDVGVLLMQFDTPTDFFPLIKQSEFRENGRFVTVGDTDGFWVETGNLIATPYDPNGLFGLDQVSRRTGNVLLWQSDGITYRLETNLDRTSAVKLAESLKPIGSSCGNGISCSIVRVSDRSNVPCSATRPVMNEG